MTLKIAPTHTNDPHPVSPQTQQPPHPTVLAGGNEAAPPLLNLLANGIQSFAHRAVLCPELSAAVCFGLGIQVQAVLRGGRLQLEYGGGGAIPWPLIGRGCPFTERGGGGGAQWVCVGVGWLKGQCETPWVNTNTQPHNHQFCCADPFEVCNVVVEKDIFPRQGFSRPTSTHTQGVWGGAGYGLPPLPRPIIKMELARWPEHLHSRPSPTLLGPPPASACPVRGNPRFHTVGGGGLPGDNFDGGNFGRGILKLLGPGGLWMATDISWWAVNVLVAKKIPPGGSISPLFLTANCSPPENRPPCTNRLCAEENSVLAPTVTNLKGVFRMQIGGEPLQPQDLVQLCTVFGGQYVKEQGLKAHDAAALEARLLERLQIGGTAPVDPSDDVVRHLRSAAPCRPTRDQRNGLGHGAQVSDGSAHG